VRVEVGGAVLVGMRVAVAVFVPVGRVVAVAPGKEVSDGFIVDTGIFELQAVRNVAISTKTIRIFDGAVMLFSQPLQTIISNFELNS
jgi:hypothetical protein